eukprot:g5850.t1
MGNDVSREISSLRSGNITRKRRAARRLGDIAMESGNKESIASAGQSITNPSLTHSLPGGIPPLMDLLKSRDRECRSNAVFAIAALADDSNNRALIIKDGGLSALVRLLAYGGHREKACAARTLGTICAEDKNARETVRTEGGIPMLVRLLKSTNIMSAHSAAMALANISTASPDLTLISLLNSEGGIAPLIQLLRRGDEHSKMWATIVLSHIADDEESRREIIDVTGVKYILPQLRSRFDDSRLNAANALASLCENNVQIQEEIVKEQGVHHLVMMLDDINDICREQAALVLNILSKNPTHYIHVIKEGAIAKCLKLLDSSCEFCRQSASCLLAHLSCAEEGCDAIVQHGGVQKMLDLVETPDELTRSNIIYILANLGESNTDRQLSIVRQVAFPC